MLRKSARLLQSALLSAAIVHPVSAYAGVLITPEEAALPIMKGAVPTSNRGITRGPKIIVVEENGVSSPIRFQVKFQPLGGSTIDVDGVKVIYLKQPNVDLTSRVKPFTQATGIDMPDAQLPPGDHLVRIDVKDSGGRISTASFLLKIMP